MSKQQYKEALRKAVSVIEFYFEGEPEAVIDEKIRQWLVSEHGQQEKDEALQHIWNKLVKYADQPDSYAYASLKKICKRLKFPTSSVKRARFSNIPMIYQINRKISSLAGCLGLLMALLPLPLIAQEERIDFSSVETEVSQVHEQLPAYSFYYPLENYIRENSYLPSAALKTNLLYGITSLTPNLAVELGTGQRTSLQLFGSYNPWNRIGTLQDNDKLVHWIIRSEFRYWFCERFNGHFLGINAFYSQFNISGKKIPLIDFKKDFRYEGYALSTGIDYGYQLSLGGRWGLEFSAGVGVVQMKYDLFECVLCSGILEEKTKTWFGPTHLSVSLEFILR
ncbi:MAG: DUF3575 domain-containing protein [Bacteroidales bacterium]|nr:DUF3575 domain-containing protein [Bacteroidales bacterium]MCL2133507.1 DUF3575 domain-containing protein [Bacteroidales bacterium]